MVEKAAQRYVLGFPLLEEVVEEQVKVLLINLLVA